jgi:hypothetical protein
LAATVPVASVVAALCRLATARPEALAAAPLVVVEVPRVTPARGLAADGGRAVGPDRLDELPDALACALACRGVPAWPPALL